MLEHARDLADVGLQAVWSLNNAAGALLATAHAIEPEGGFQIWDEAQTEIAVESDFSFRRAETIRLITHGRHEEALRYQAPPEAGLVRLLREVITPRRN